MRLRSTFSSNALQESKYLPIFKKLIMCALMIHVLPVPVTVYSPGQVQLQGSSNHGAAKSTLYACCSFLPCSPYFPLFTPSSVYLFLYLLSLSPAIVHLFPLVFFALTPRLPTTLSSSFCIYCCIYFC